MVHFMQSGSALKPGHGVGKATAKFEPILGARASGFHLIANADPNRCPGTQMSPTGMDQKPTIVSKNGLFRGRQAVLAGDSNCQWWVLQVVSIQRKPWQESHRRFPRSTQLL
jgi:hypothetical protein